MAYIPIGVRQVQGVNGAFAHVERYGEAAVQTFKIGVPLVLSNGFLQESGTISGATNTILGFGMEAGNNLVTAGVAKTLTYGTVQGQSAAVLIPVGAPPNDGTMGVLVAEDNIIYMAATLVTHALVATDLGALFGLTKDSTSGQWYVDTTITSTGSGACLRVEEIIDPIGTLGGRVGFTLLGIFQQIRN